MPKCCLVILLLMCVVATPAFAQTVDDSEAVVRQDNIEALKSERPIVEYGLAGAFLLGALVLAFMNSKRTHLD